MMRIRAAAMAGLVVFATTPAAFAGGQLIYDDSFEKPKVPAGTYVNFNLGQYIYSNGSVNAWLVIGPNASSQVTLIGCPYVEGSVTYNAAHGHNFVDLTGDGANVMGEGVQQTIATDNGANYLLKFKVGNVVGTSTVNLWIDGVNVLTATNNSTNGGTSVNWQTFSYTFTANNAGSTTIAFTNGDAADDHFNGLDVAKLKHL